MFVVLSRFALSSMDMEQRDYDSRTALHVAAAEGETLMIPPLMCVMISVCVQGADVCVRVCFRTR